MSIGHCEHTEEGEQDQMQGQTQGLGLGRGAAKLEEQERRQEEWGNHSKEKTLRKIILNNSAN